MSLSLVRYRNYLLHCVLPYSTPAQIHHLLQFRSTPSIHLHIRLNYPTLKSLAFYLQFFSKCVSEAPMNSNQRPTLSHRRIKNSIDFIRENLQHPLRSSWTVALSPNWKKHSIFLAFILINFLNTNK